MSKWLLAGQPSNPVANKHLDQTQKIIHDDLQIFGLVDSIRYSRGIHLKTDTVWDWVIENSEVCNYIVGPTSQKN